LLTQEEKDAETFLEWSDETLAAAVRETARLLKDEKGTKAVWFMAATQVMAHSMAEANAETMKTAVEGDTKGVPWKLTVNAKLTKGVPA
jgi:hypothetical protein